MAVEIVVYVWVFLEQPPSSYLHAGKPRVAGADTRTANDVGALQKVALTLLLQHAIALLVGDRQLSRLVLQLLQLLQLRGAGRTADLIVQRQKRDRRIDGLATLGAQTHHAETGAVNLLTTWTYYI